MKPSVESITGIPSGILSAMIVTAALFLTLPLLTQLRLDHSTQAGGESVLINPYKPPPPPSLERDMPEEQSPPEKEFIQKDSRSRQVRPAFDIPGANPFAGGRGGIEIAIASLEEIGPIPGVTYMPGEVDQQPVLLRSFQPQYPFLARRDNIEGWVTVRFVVDVDGSVKKADVLAAEPSGIFEKVTLNAVLNYRFKPAEKNGEAVRCIMKHRIRFNLD